MNKGLIQLYAGIGILLVIGLVVAYPNMTAYIAMDEPYTKYENKITIEAEENETIHIVFNKFKPPICDDGIYITDGVSPVYFNTLNEIYSDGKCHETDIVLLSSYENAITGLVAEGGYETSTTIFITTSTLTEDIISTETTLLETTTTLPEETRTTFELPQTIILEITTTTFTETATSLENPSITLQETDTTILLPETTTSSNPETTTTLENPLVTLQETTTTFPETTTLLLPETTTSSNSETTTTLENPLVTLQETTTTFPETTTLLLPETTTSSNSETTTTLLETTSTTLPESTETTITKPKKTYYIYYGLIENLPPISSLPDTVKIKTGQTFLLNLNNYFSDPNGDELTYKSE